MTLDGCIPSDTVHVPHPDGPVYKLAMYIPPRGDVSNWTNVLLDTSLPPIPPSLDPSSSDTTTNGDIHSTMADKKSLAIVLNHALYGTVDGTLSRNWSIALSTEMKQLGYYKSCTDQSVRTCFCDNKHTITATYSDDITGVTTTKEGYQVAMRELGRKFELKDMGKLKFVIGMCIKHNWSTRIAKCMFALSLNAHWTTLG